VDTRPKLAFLMILAVFLAALGANSASQAAPANLAPELVVFPQTAVPNQTVALLGTGFTPSGADGNSGLRQITGIGASVIRVGGAVLTSSEVNYPITFGDKGDWAAPIAIPINAETVAGGPVPITVVDDQGLTVTAQVIIKTPAISLDPASGGRRSELTITGEGFPATDSPSGTGVQVAIVYAGTQLAIVSPDSDGEISAMVRVPVTAAIQSNSTVRATIVAFNQSATAIHSVPGPSISISPTSGRAGSAVLVSGEGYPINARVTSISAANVTVTSSPAPITDDDGKFVSSFIMPLFSPGVRTITATAGRFTAVKSFTVIQGEAVIETLPTPRPSTGPAQALGTLTQGDNLVRVWNFNNSTKRWTFFDPRPAFARANTIRAMVPGSVYWIRVNKVQSASLNGKAALLAAGWNLVTW